MMKSRRQGIGTIILWWLTICCSVLLIAGCGGKQITPQEYFTVLDANETKIDQILVDTSKGRGYRFNGKWYSFSELARNPELKSGTLDEVAVVKEYLQSIDKWNI